MNKNDPVWVLESRRWFKVVWCEKGRPAGGCAKNRNYLILADGLTRQEAVAFARRLRS